MGQTLRVYVYTVYAVTAVGTGFDLFDLADETNSVTQKWRNCSW